MYAFRRTTLALIAGILAVSCLAVPTAQASSPSGTLGVYTGGGNAQGADSFANWLGHPVGRVLDFIDGSSWSSIESPTWLANRWSGSGSRVDFSVPMIPATGGSLATGASGGYNSHFAKLAQNLVARGQSDAVIRIGWEFNGSWFRWSAASDPASYAAYFRQIVTTMRGVSGQHFEFEWNPSLGKVDVAPDQAYPGDSYVDYIGVDIYDQSWISNYKDPVARWTNFMNQPYGLAWQRDFAAQHGKPMTFPEWGLAIRDDGHGGGDNPYFIQKMHDWIAANNVAASYYFEFDAGDGLHELMNSHFPQAAATFKNLFGSGGDPSPAPDPAPAPDPSPAPDPTPAPAPSPSPTPTPAPSTSPTPTTTPTAPSDPQKPRQCRRGKKHNCNRAHAPKSKAKKRALRKRARR